MVDKIWSTAQYALRDYRTIMLMEDNMANDQNELSQIREDMLQRSVGYLMKQGKSKEDALTLAKQMLDSPSHHPIPTLEELDD